MSQSDREAVIQQLVEEAGWEPWFARNIVSWRVSYAKRNKIDVVEFLVVRFG